MDTAFKTTTEVLVIGAGTAGLAASRHLSEKGIGHVVVEATSSAGGSWKKRWDSFCLNTPNWINALGGEDDPQAASWDKDGFLSRDEFVSYLVSVGSSLPIHFDRKCTSIVQGAEGTHGFLVNCTNLLDSTIHSYQCRFVVVASGSANIAKKSPLSQNLPTHITSIDSNEYMNPSQLRDDGHVLVVGGGNTGAQIVEDILRKTDKVVYWATCKNGRFPRRILGFDSLKFPVESGFFMQAASDVPKEERHGPQPLISGVGHRGHSLSIQYLHSLGAIPLGSCTRCDANSIYFESNLIDHVKHGDFFYDMIKSMSLKFYESRGITAASLAADSSELHSDDDINDRPFDGDVVCERSGLSLNQCATISELPLSISPENRISTIIWCIGFIGDYSYIQIPGALDEETHSPLHVNGISTNVAGLYFNGLLMQRNRLSHLVAGAVQDAAFVVDDIAKQLATA